MANRVEFKTMGLEVSVHSRLKQAVLNYSVRAGKRMTVTDVVSQALDALDDRSSRSTNPWELVASKTTSESTKDDTAERELSVSQAT